MASSSKSQAGKHEQLVAGRDVAFKKMTAIRSASQLDTEWESAPLVETISTLSHLTPRPLDG